MKIVLDGVSRACSDVTRTLARTAVPAHRDPAGWLWRSRTASASDAGHHGAPRFARAECELADDLPHAAP